MVSYFADRNQGDRPHTGLPRILNAKPQTRIIVVGLVRDQGGRLLLCKMKPDRGVFSGQWGLPGGGMESGEKMEEALRRELREELGI